MFDHQKFIKQELRKKKMTQSELAKKLGVSRQNLGVKLRAKNIYLNTFLEICKILES